MSSFKFNICPPGNGVDTHRFWESLMFKTVPIVVKTEFTSNLQNLGVPGLYLNNWSDLNKLSEEELNTVYKEIVEKNNFEVFLSYVFWKELIKKTSINI